MKPKIVPNPKPHQAIVVAKFVVSIIKIPSNEEKILIQSATISIVYLDY